MRFRLGRAGQHPAQDVFFRTYSGDQAVLDQECSVFVFREHPLVFSGERFSPVDRGIDSGVSKNCWRHSRYSPAVISTWLNMVFHCILDHGFLDPEWNGDLVAVTRSVC